MMAPAQPYNHVLGAKPLVLAVSAFEASPGRWWRLITAADDATAKLWSTDGICVGEIKSLPKLDTLIQVIYKT